MKTDKELLELAAKAAGYNVKAHEDGTLYSDYRCSGYWGVFDPLTDDGDALRLAVKLGITVRRISNKAMASSSVGQFDEYCDGDPYTATRRAIVRAAAAIGEKL